ncbi:MAG: SusC/RagA family TonB-linked outer membrane protein [Paludibacter sp.]|nr:SusC/RagA family TonB-linked outer membrane protein [Paludibacter sp.]
MTKKLIFVIAIIVLLICSGKVTAENISQVTFKVQGKVVNGATGKPLAGIHIDLTGLTSEITNDDGSFTMVLPKNDVVLVVTGAGYAKKEVAIRGHEQLIIQLFEVGYKGSQKDIYTFDGKYHSSTYLPNTWSSISENTDLSVAETPDALFKGSLSGVNSIIRSGLPGNGSNIYIRGLNSMNAGAMPLFVVDGIPMENSNYSTSLIDNYFANPLSSIDVKDIESITVLKDGTSIYGVKGGNGVILIKTKKAKELKTTINAHLHTGINVEPVQFPVLNASEHKYLLAELIQRQNLDMSFAEMNTLPYFNTNKPVMQSWGYEGNPDYYRYNHETNWQDQIYQNSINQNYYLNVSGGDEVANYMLSLGFLNQKGTIINTGYQRFNTRFNAEVKLTNKSYFHTNMSYIFGTKNLVNEGSNIRFNPILSALTKSPFTSTHFYTEEGTPSPNVEDYDIFGNSNPYVLINNNLVENLNYRFLGNFLLGTKISKDLDLNMLLGINYNKGRERIFYSSTGIKYDQINNTDVRNESQHNVNRLLSLYLNAFANYNKQISIDHKIAANAGFRYQSNNAEDDYGRGYNSLSDDFKGIGYGDALLRRIGGSIGAWNWLSAYANLDYTISNRYLFNLAVSADGTSRSGENAPTMFLYPQVAAAWIVSSEKFMKELDWISLLKIRGSLGVSGNDEIGNNTAHRYYVSQNILGNYGMALGNLADTFLEPEKMTRMNGGFDFSIFNERINLGLDLYSNTISNMILQTTPDQRTGFSTSFSNAGKMRNTGVDISVNVRVFNTESFKWDLGLNVSHNKNLILNLSDEEFISEVLGANIQTKVGQPLGVFYGYETNGVYSTKSDAQADGLYEMHGLVQVPFGAGDVKFVNQTGGDNLIDENDRIIIGNPNPDLYGGITSSFKYKNWMLYANFLYSLGNDVYNYTRSQLEGLSTYNNQSLSTLTRWKKEGDITTLPMAILGDPMGNARFSDRWIEDGSYLRMKTLTIEYQFPQNLKLFVNQFTVFATAENLLTFTKYKGVDPEFAFGQSPLYYGIDPCVSAQPRIFSIGLSLGL